MVYRVVKRVFDFVCALIGILGTSPFWIIAIVGILVSDWGPIFYVATRIGKDNMPTPVCREAMALTADWCLNFLEEQGII